MHPQNKRHSRSAHNAPEVSNSNTSHFTRLGPHSRSHVYPTQSGSYPQVGVPSASVAELRNTAGPSGRQGSVHQEEGPHVTSQSSGHGARDLAPTDASRPCSGPDRHIPRQSNPGYPFTNSSPSAIRWHPYYKDPHAIHRLGFVTPSSRCRMDSQLGGSSDSRGVVESGDYIRAWQGTLPPPNSSETQSTQGILRTSPPPPPRDSSWSSWFKSGMEPVRPAPRQTRPGGTVPTGPPPPPSIIRPPMMATPSGTVPTSHQEVHTGPPPPSSIIRPPMMATPFGMVPTPGRTPDVRAGPPQPLPPQHISATTQSLFSRPKTTVDVAVQTVDQSDFVRPYPDPPSPVPDLSWLLEDDGNDGNGHPEPRMTSAVPEPTTAEQHLPQRFPSPSTNVHSLFPPLPPHIPPPGDQVNAVFDVVKSVYVAHPEVRCNGIALIIPSAFRDSCPEFHLFDGLQHLDASYMRLMAGFYKLDVFYEEINRDPENVNPAPEFIPIPPVHIPQASFAHRFALGRMLSQIIRFKWIVHILYGTTGGMTGFFRANDTRPISPEESQSYVKMRDELRRFTDRARGSYTPPAGVRPKDKLDLDEIRQLVEMLILAGGKLFTKEMGEPISTPPNFPFAGPFFVVDQQTTSPESTHAPTPAYGATTTSQAEVLSEPSTTSAPHVTPPSSSSPQTPLPAYEAKPDVTLGSHPPDSSATLTRPGGGVPTSHPLGGIQWRNSEKREGVLWGTDTSVAEEMRRQFVERTARDHPILSALLPMAGDDPDTRTALAVIVQDYGGGSIPKDRKDITSRDELWKQISGTEAFEGMTTVVRETSIQLSRQRVDPAGLDQHIMKGLVETFTKNPEVKPEFVHAFSALKEAIRKLFHHVCKTVDRLLGWTQLDPHGLFHRRQQPE